MPGPVTPMLASLVSPVPGAPAPQEVRPAPPLHRAGVRFGLQVLLWTLVGLAFVVQYVALHFIEGIPFSWEIAGWQFVGWYVWLALTPLIAYLTRRHPITSTTWPRRVALHLGFAALISAGEVAFYTGLRWAVDVLVLGRTFDPAEYYRYAVLRSLFFDVLFYTCIAAVTHAFALESAARKRAVRLERLERQLAEAELRALRMQLNPHFLFNTLHTISAIMDENVPGARRLMADLSDLLRRSLDGVRRPFVTLDEEIDFLSRYLNIEQERLGDRLSVRFDVDEDARAALVPHLILQPLVENAIRHAIAPFAAGGTITVTGHVEGEVLVLAVEDDGPGVRDNAPTSSTGIGLPTTRDRLKGLYGEAGTLDVDSTPGAGTTVMVRMPYLTDVLEAVA
jgi:two-component system, LytTR family, sensor kinase